MMLEEAGFQSQQRQHMAHEHLFSNYEVIAAHIQNIPKPVDPQKYLIYKNGKTTHRNLNQNSSVAQLSWW